MAKAKTKKKRVTFRFEGTPGSEVIVTGSFNDWTVADKKKAKIMKEAKEENGVYTLNMFLPEGEYEYKFYADGSWHNDPKAETHKQNVFGTFNSIIEVA